MRVIKGQYIEVSIPVIQKIQGSLSFDLYVKRTKDNFTKIMTNGDLIDHDRINAYLAKGVKAFYVTHLQYMEFLNHVQRLTNHYFKESADITPKEASFLIKELINLTMVEILQNVNINEQAVENAGQLVKGCIELIQKDPLELIKILKMMGNHHYLLKHSISTSIFSILLAKGLKIESEKLMHIIGLGAFLHDIGMSKLPFEAEAMRKDEISPEEWREVMRHTEYGKRMLDDKNTIPSEVKNVILQHHEQFNGNGYPNGLRGNQIFLPAQIVTIADNFSALITKRPYREKAFSPKEALTIMREDIGKFDPRLLETFTKTFGKLA